MPGEPESPGMFILGFVHGNICNYDYRGSLIIGADMKLARL
jgi:hypothetical protein